MPLHALGSQLCCMQVQLCLLLQVENARHRKEIAQSFSQNKQALWVIKTNKQTNTYLSQSSWWQGKSKWTNVGKHIEEYGLAHDIFPCYLSSTRYMSCSQEPGLRSLWEGFNQENKNHSKEKHALLGYFAILVSTLNVFWTVAHLVFLSTVAALVVINCSVHHPMACCPSRRASDTDWHHPEQTESWV